MGRKSCAGHCRQFITDWGLRPVQGWGFERLRKVVNGAAPAVVVCPSYPLDALSVLNLVFTHHVNSPRLHTCGTCGSLRSTWQVRARTPAARPRSWPGNSYQTKTLFACLVPDTVKIKFWIFTIIHFGSIIGKSSVGALNFGTPLSHQPKIAWIEHWQCIFLVFNFYFWFFVQQSYRGKQLHDLIYNRKVKEIQDFNQCECPLILISCG